jgi:bifunctional UDP-N-acetylglucosamine pyrophosphorylase/glucosamine-1-phosphate N-acetyltransferase
MKSPIPKVLHKVGGRTLLDRVIDTVQATGCEKIVVVVGKDSAAVRELVARRLGEGAIAVQDPPLGTGHAVLAAGQALEGFQGDVLVTNGDCPLLQAQDLQPLFKLRQDGAALALLGFEPQDTLLYGRLIRGADGHVIRIVEPKEATQEQLAVRACYAGMLCADRDALFGWLSRVTNDNAKGAGGKKGDGSCAEFHDGLPRTRATLAASRPRRQGLVSLGARSMTRPEERFR